MWHTKSIAETAAALGTSLDSGLTAQEVERRSTARVEGPKAPTTSALRLLWNQLKGGVIVVLLLAMIASFLLGEMGNAVGIGLSVVLSVFFGFLTDFRAERALEGLRELSAPTAQVLRDGVEREIPTQNVRVGDVLILHPGARMPADARLGVAQDLRMDESLLTGESDPAAKTVAALPADRPVSDRSNMAFSGTSVVTGYGKAIVTSVGNDSELGRIGRLVEEQEKKDTPLQKQAEQLGRQLSLLFILLSAATIGLGLLRHHPLLMMVETGVILAIAAIPEGLPAVTTVALAAGVHRMAKLHALVRRISSVETLGTVSVICTDKTGTLTENNMRVTRILLPDRELAVSGSGYEPLGEFRYAGEIVDPGTDPALRSLLRIARICNNARLEAHEDSG
ncbi:MAG TPA: HAD-IC family P-type ATPase, partial [Planctomycetota bacterium]|nr:HAD-IC family P-type ATPase [Planctomycetota bacterium]